MSYPTVSVIIPAYNQAQFVSQAISSVLAQTFTDYEIIVINDGSTDETAQILANFGDRIRIIHQSNAGLSAARNRGLDAAWGEIIALLDADDLWYPEMLSVTVPHLISKPSVDLVCGAWDVIDESGKTLKSANRPSLLQARIEADFLRAIATGNLFLVHALLIRRKCFERCGTFDPALGGVADWDMWIRLAAHGYKIGLIDVPVARYRRHSGCMTRNPRYMEADSNRVLKKLFSDERLTEHLADLREHAYIEMWLTIAGYCHESGLDADRCRYVQMAEELFQQAPKNRELSLLHLSRLLSLPETDHFVRTIAASMPETLLQYYWFKAWQMISRGDYKSITGRLRWSNISSIAVGLKDGFLRQVEEENELEQVQNQ